MLLWPNTASLELFRNDTSPLFGRMTITSLLPKVPNLIPRFCTIAEATRGREDSR